MKKELYCVKPGYIVREIAGEYLAVPVNSDCGASSHIIILNPVSKFLWEQMQTEKTFDELVKAIVENYGISQEEAEADMKDFIGELEENNLLN